MILGALTGPIGATGTAIAKGSSAAVKFGITTGAGLVAGNLVSHLEIIIAEVKCTFRWCQWNRFRDCTIRPRRGSLSWNFCKINRNRCG